MKMRYFQSDEEAKKWLNEPIKYIYSRGCYIYEDEQQTNDTLKYKEIEKCYPELLKREKSGG